MTELINTLEQIDTHLLLFLNGFHNAYWDYFMMMFSSRFVWAPFYVSFVYVMFRNYPPKDVAKCLIAIVAIILLSDQTASTLLKPMVERMRPSNMDNPIAPMVHVVSNYRGGRYGFPSSHAANAWGMAFFATYLVRNRKLSTFLMLWAAMMAYSRIYMGVHYPGDLFVGLLIGWGFATLCYWLMHHYDRTTTQQWQYRPGSLRHAQVPILMGLATIVVLLMLAGIMSYMNADVFFK